MEKLLSVNGMSCNHCKMAVENALNNLEGVKSVSVNLDEGNVFVHYDEDVVTLGDIRKEIEDQGYDIVQWSLIAVISIILDCGFYDHSTEMN